MSRTFTSKPGVTNTRGRGRGNQTRAVQAVNANRMEETNREAGRGARPRVPGRAAQPQAAQPFHRDRMAGQRQIDEEGLGEETQTPDMERRMTYQGGYSMITPNQRRRQEVNQVAQRETAAYQAHKQQNTPSSFNLVGTAGGGQTQAEARRKLAQENRSKTQKLLQNAERKTYFKQKDEEEIQKKKEEQRKKALLNEKRRKEEESDAEHRWDNPKKVVNDAFLRRIENKNKRQTGAQAPTSTQTTQSRSSELAGRLQPAGAFGTSASVSMETNQFTEPDEDLSPAEEQRVSQLTAIFPQYAREEILGILKQVNFSLDSAVAILQD